MKRVVIVGASRTPFGRFRGSLAALSPVELASAATGSVLSVCDSTKVDQVFLGNVLSAGQGMNIARQVVRHVGLPLQVAATTVNMMCGSGLQAVRLGVAAIRSGEANVVLCGGCESMSASGMHVSRPRKGEKIDPQSMLDLMQRDGLTDPETGEHMGIQTERLAQSDGISRTQQDEFALRSQQLYQAAKRDGVFTAEITGLPQLAEDEHPRDHISMQDLRSLRPGFHEDGSITAGNSSGINDGAAMLIVSDRDYALSQGWPVLCEWVDSAVTGCDPNEMGLGPAFVSADRVNEVEEGHRLLVHRGRYGNCRLVAEPRVASGCSRLAVGGAGVITQAISHGSVCGRQVSECPIVINEWYGPGHSSQWTAPGAETFNAQISVHLFSHVAKLSHNLRVQSCDVF
ncbi:MAG: thiolase family protein [Planctomycetaceae bacterium]